MTGKKVAIVGAGAVGLEMGLIFHKLGSEVHILEIMSSILPGSDRALTVRLERLLRLQGLNIYTQMRIEESEIKIPTSLFESVVMFVRVLFEEEER